MLDTKQRNLADYIRQAQANGVEYLLSVSVDLNQFPQLLAIAEQFPQVALTVGQHPHEVTTFAMTFEQLLEAAKHPLTPSEAGG
jgi:TatD DNase family protein